MLLGETLRKRRTKRKNYLSRRVPIQNGNCHAVQTALISPRSENHNDQKTNLTKIISRSFGCCLYRNLEISHKKAALEMRPERGALKAFFLWALQVPDTGRK